MKTLQSLLLAVTVLKVYQCQVYYQPVQVLFPTINGTHLVTNYTIQNKSTPSYIPNNSKWNNGSQDGHLLLGTIQPFDHLLFNQEFIKPSRWWSNREKIFEYPKDLPVGYSRHETISAIRIYNKFLDGHGAQAYIINGGIGRQYVKLRLVSPFRKGLQYLVQIYGR